MSFSLQRDNTLNVLHTEEVGRALVFRSKLLYFGTFCEGYIVFVSRQNLAWIFLCCFLYKVEKTAFHHLSVDDELAAEYLVATVFRVYLCKTKHLRVGQWAVVLLFYLM